MRVRITALLAVVLCLPIGALAQTKIQQKGPTKPQTQVQCHSQQVATGKQTTTDKHQATTQTKEPHALHYPLVDTVAIKAIPDSLNLPCFEQLRQEFILTSPYRAVSQKFAQQGFGNGGIIFTGSSTITLWSMLESDFAGLDVKNRGIGGSTLRDVIASSDELIFANHPRLVVLYIGDNDAYVYELDKFKEYMNCFVANFRHRLPNARLILVSMKPAPTRVEKYSYFVQVNQFIKSFDSKRVAFIDIWNPIIDSGKVSSYFFDGLHMNRKGYEILINRLKPLLY